MRKGHLYIFVFFFLFSNVIAGWIRPMSNSTGAGVETDPIFTSHIAYQITAGNISLWNSASGSGGNSTSQIREAVNNTGIYNINISCTNIQGGSDGNYCSDSVGYNSLADLQTAVTNDFHNLGGTDLTGITEAGLNGAISSNLSKYINQSMISTYANQSWVSDSNTTLWTAINLKASILNVQSWLSTYMNKSNVSEMLSTYVNLTMFQASNNTQDSRLDTIESANYITNATMNKSVNCLNIVGGSDGDFCSDATGLGITEAGLKDALQTNLSSYANKTYVQDSNTTLWNAINLRETIANVQTYLSTYLNETKFALTNITLWSAINNRLINGTKLGNSTAEINAVIPIYNNGTMQNNTGKWNINISNTNVIGSTISGCSDNTGRMYNVTLTNGTITASCGTDATGSAVSSSSNYQTVRLTSNLTSYKGLIGLNISGMNFTLYAGNNYDFEYKITYQSNDTTGGVRLGLWFPTSDSRSASISIIQSDTDGVAIMLSGALAQSGDNVTTASVGTINRDYLATITGTITPTVSGTLQVFYASELATTNITIKKGSMGRLFNNT